MADGTNEGFSVPSLVPNQTSRSLSGEQNSNPSAFKTIYLDKTPFPLSNEEKTNDVSRFFFEEKESEMDFRC